MKGQTSLVVIFGWQRCIMCTVLFNIMVVEAIKRYKTNLKKYNVGYWTMAMSKLSKIYTTLMIW